MLDCTSGMTGSQNVESQLVDIVVESMDGTTVVELENVRTVKDIPISKDCMPRKQDLRKWPHLQNIDLSEAQCDKVMLIIGLKEIQQLFLQLEYKAGETSEPIAVRYSLGWTIMGSVGSEKASSEYSVNLLQTSTSNETSFFNQIREFENDELKTAYPVNEERLDNAKCLSSSQQSDIDNPQLVVNTSVRDGVEEGEFQENTLRQQIEGLWKTDFGDTIVDTRPGPSVEDKRALEMMEDSIPSRKLMVIIKFHYRGNHIHLIYQIIEPSPFEGANC